MKVARTGGKKFEWSTKQREKGQQSHTTVDGEIFTVKIFSPVA